MESNFTVKFDARAILAAGPLNRNKSQPGHVTLPSEPNIWYLNICRVQFAEVGHVWSPGRETRTAAAAFIVGRQADRPAGGAGGRVDAPVLTWPGELGPSPVGRQACPHVVPPPPQV